MCPATPLPLSLSSLQNKTRRSATIAAELRRLIQCGQLKPGDQLPTENVLCQQFGVSRTTLREAIQMLRTTGLLDVTPGRGSFVRVPDMRQLMTDMALAGAHTPQATQDAFHLIHLMMRDLLPTLSKTQPQHRKDAYQSLLNRLATPDENARMEDVWFLTLAKMAGNDLQCVLMEALLALTSTHRIARYRNPDDVLRTVHIQMRVNAALVDGDFALAERVLTQYLTQPAPALHVA